MIGFIALPARYLVAQLTHHDDPRLVSACVNGFFSACVIAARYNHNDMHWEQLFDEHTQSYFNLGAEMFDETTQDYYLQHVVASGQFKVVDHHTGRTDIHSWYGRYKELVDSLNKYYRHDVIALIRKVNETGSVTSLRYINHDASIIHVEVNYNLLIGHEGG
jgi:hypothetical protein